MACRDEGERTIRVNAPARLHLGFLDLDFGLGRRFGSLGLAVDRPVTRLTMTRAARLEIEGPDAERAERILDRLGEAFEIEPSVRLDIEEVIPAHMGFGSGTQLGLAIGAAFCRLNNCSIEPEALAIRLGRGGRSAIGVAAFGSGGFLLDGGRGPRTRVAPVVARLPFPEDWRVLLVLDRAHQGLHGDSETAAFRDAPALGADTAAHLCRLVLMRALPGLAEHDLGAFGSAIAEIQRRLGDHFAMAQGGRFTSPKVAEVLAWLEARGVAGVGQTSWGPSGFAFLASEAEAERLQAALTARYADDPALAFILGRGRNRGADIRDGGAEPARQGEAQAT